MLEHLGHEVAEAPDGEEGLRFIRNGGRPEAVVLDLVLPGIDGWACLERIRYMAPFVPIVVITGDAAAPLLRGISHLGRAAHLAKPFGVEDLGKALRCASESVSS
jgi:CheY-like chemotaxis protein